MDAGWVTGEGGGSVWVDGAPLLPLSSRLPECNLPKPLIKSILEVVKVSPKICSFSKLSLRKIYGQGKYRQWRREGGQGERKDDLTSVPS